MENIQSIIQEGVELTKSLKETSIIGVIKEVTLFIYTHEDLQEIGDWEMSEYLDEIVEKSGIWSDKQELDY